MLKYCIFVEFFEKPKIPVTMFQKLNKFFIKKHNLMNKNMMSIFLNYLFAFLFVAAVVISLVDKNKVQAAIEENEIPKTSRQVKILFALLGLVILSLYLIFNFH